MDPSKGGGFNPDEPYSNEAWGWSSTSVSSSSHAQATALGPSSEGSCPWVPSPWFAPGVSSPWPESGGSWPSFAPGASRPEPMSSGTSSLSDLQRFQLDQLAACLMETAGEAVKRDRDDGDGVPKVESQQHQTPEFVLPDTILNYKPDFKTLAPPLHHATDEVHWMHPMERSFFKLLIDTALEDSFPDEDKYPTECQLFKTAIAEPLPLAQRQTLIREIETHPDLVNFLEVSPGSLPDLVKHNQQVAIAVLLSLMEQRSITNFLDVLVDMELSVNTMEVVNRLANNLMPGSQGAALPRPFLHTYISNSIVHCGNITTPQLQNRQARLVCVFLQSLFRNNIIDIHLIPQPLLFQIEAFCVEFGRIREATALFTYIKELESTDPPPSALSAEVSNPPQAGKDASPKSSCDKNVTEEAGPSRSSS